VQEVVSNASDLVEGIVRDRSCRRGSKLMVATLRLQKCEFRILWRDGRHVGSHKRVALCF